MKSNLILPFFLLTLFGILASCEKQEISDVKNPIDNSSKTNPYEKYGILHNKLVTTVLNKKGEQDLESIYNTMVQEVSRDYDIKNEEIPNFTIVNEEYNNSINNTSIQITNDLFYEKKITKEQKTNLDEINKLIKTYYNSKEFDAKLSELEQNYLTDTLKYKEELITISIASYSHALWEEYYSNKKEADFMTVFGADVVGGIIGGVLTKSWIGGAIVAGVASAGAFFAND